MPKKIVQVIVTVISIVFGAFIYVCFRSTNLLLFKWFSYLKFDYAVFQLRSNFNKLIILPEWALYALPDGLWIFSFTTLILFIWDNTITNKNIYLIFFIPLCALISELLQLINIIRGTYDVNDILAYIIGFGMSIFIFSNNRLFLK